MHESQFEYLTLKSNNCMLIDALGIIQSHNLMDPDVTRTSTCIDEPGTSEL